jgi:valyl-tRNA synthetase
MLKKDNDTFDTWFSSSQWPFATLGYPDSPDFKAYYPTDVMETAGEIIFFWVSRMIMLGLYITGKVPFKTVYLHGLVLDAKGQKMSKSKGNVINPLDLTAKYGTDAFRMGLIVGNTPGTSLALSEDKVTAYKKFTNKLWNIARFVLSTADGERGKDQPKAPSVAYDPDFKEWSEADKALMKSLNDLIAEVTREMDEYKFYIVAEKLYHYVWHDFADLVIEGSKPILSGTDQKASMSRIQFLLHAFQAVLRLLHPFMPFVTEEIWKDVPIPAKKLLMVEKWPS